MSPTPPFSVFLFAGSSVYRFSLSPRGSIWLDPIPTGSLCSSRFAIIPIQRLPAAPQSFRLEIPGVPGIAAGQNGGTPFILDPALEGPNDPDPIGEGKGALMGLDPGITGSPCDAIVGCVVLRPSPIVRR